MTPGRKPPPSPEQAASDALFSLACRIGMCDASGPYTEDDIYAHILWLEERAREQATINASEAK